MKIDDETYGAVKLNKIVIGILSVSDIVRVMLVSVNSDQVRKGSILEVDRVSNKFVQGFLTCVPIRGGSAQKAYLFQASGIIMKGLGFHKLRCMKGKGNLDLGIPFFLVLKCC